MNAYAMTDVGKTRTVNQDYVYCSRHSIGKLPNLFIVADGMGGHKAGDLASKFSVQTFVEAVKSSKKENPISIISDAIQYTNKKLNEMAATSPDYTGMGTTFVVVSIEGLSAYVANIGDSRLYVMSDELRQITRDHSLVEEMVHNGTLERDDACYHENKNIITRALGGNTEVIPDFFEVELSKNETILMCTDGMSNMISDSEMASIIKSNEDLVDQGTKLIEKANENGGKDNISVILIDL